MNPWLEPLTRRRRYTVAPRTWVPGELVTAGMMNTLRDQLLEIEAGTAAIKGTTANFSVSNHLTLLSPVGDGSVVSQGSGQGKFLQLSGGPVAVTDGSAINLYGKTSPYGPGSMAFYTSGSGVFVFYPAGTGGPAAMQIGSTGITNAAKINTLQGISAASPSGVAVTLFALPGIQSYESSLYIVQASLPSNDSPNYGAYALIIQLGGSARILHQVNANLMQITLSGLTVLGAQSCGAAASVYWSYLRIPA